MSVWLQWPLTLNLLNALMACLGLAFRGLGRGARAGASCIIGEPVDRFENDCGEHLRDTAATFDNRGTGRFYTGKSSTATLRRTVDTEPNLKE